jgi:hypothetical protein
VVVGVDLSLARSLGFESGGLGVVWGGRLWMDRWRRQGTSGEESFMGRTEEPRWLHVARKLQTATACGRISYLLPSNELQDLCAGQMPYPPRAPPIPFIRLQTRLSLSLSHIVCSFLLTDYSFCIYFSLFRNFHQLACKCIALCLFLLSIFFHNFGLQRPAAVFYSTQPVINFL